MDKQSREVLTAYRPEQAKETITEAELLIELGVTQLKKSIRKCYVPEYESSEM